jgi:hypothetical protein
MACGSDASSATSSTAVDPFSTGSAGQSGIGGIGGTGISSPSGAAGTGISGATGTGTSGTSVCEAKTVDSGRLPPDMLIVLDRSGSMRMGNVNRWDPSVSALKTLTAQLGSTIHFGLMTFPGKGGSSMPPAPVAMQDCNALTDIVEQLACVAANAAAGGGGGGQNRDTCGAGSIDVPIAPNNGAAIASALDSMSPNGATPTAATLNAAHTALGTSMAGPDAVVAPKYVLLVTDGAPNCTNGGGGRNNGYDAQAVDQSVAEIASMAKDGIKTFVIGYNTKSDAQLSAALDRMAQAGDTGDQQHHAIEDGMSLLTEFEKIAGAAASCEFVLNTQPSDPSYVEVKLDGKQINLNDANGWLISADRRRITLQGSACAAISGKEQHLLSVRVLCEAVVLQ